MAALEAQDDDRLIVGFDLADDGGVVRLENGTCLVQTVDFLTPIADDPFTYGAIAAANALSDIYAMGGEPISALNVLCWPQGTLPEEVLAEILRGGLSKIREAGALLVGGHSVRDPELKYGLAVTGQVEEAGIWTNAGARPGDVLVLTKPLGTGVIATAVKGDSCSIEVEAGALESMLRLNREARNRALPLGVHSCTDITGNGLLGHAWEMAHASGVELRLDLASIPLLEGALDLAADHLPGGATANAELVQGQVQWGSTSDNHRDLLLDPQTSGGLLFALPASGAASLAADGLGAIIGEVGRGPARIRIGAVANGHRG